MQKNVSFLPRKHKNAPRRTHFVLLWYCFYLWCRWRCRCCMAACLQSLRLISRRCIFLAGTAVILPHRSQRTNRISLRSSFLWAKRGLRTSVRTVTVCGERRWCRCPCALAPKAVLNIAATMSAVDKILFITLSFWGVNTLPSACTLSLCICRKKWPVFRSLSYGMQLSCQTISPALLSVRPMSGTRPGEDERWATEKRLIFFVVGVRKLRKIV